MEGINKHLFNLDFPVFDNSKELDGEVISKVIERRRIYILLGFDTFDEDIVESKDPKKLEFEIETHAYMLYDAVLDYSNAENNGGKPTTYLLSENEEDRRVYWYGLPITIEFLRSTLDFEYYIATDSEYKILEEDDISDLENMIATNNNIHGLIVTIFGYIHLVQSRDIVLNPFTHPNPNEHPEQTAHESYTLRKVYEKQRSTCYK